MSDSRPYRAGQDEQLDPWTVASYGESSGDSTIAVVVKHWSALGHVGTGKDLNSTYILYLRLGRVCRMAGAWRGGGE